MAGYSSMVQATTGRSDMLSVVGHSLPTKGTVDDSVQVRGFLAGAFAAIRVGDRFPVRLRLNAGAAIGAVVDTRVGQFHVSDQTVVADYSVGPVVEAPSLTWLYLEPEVRVGFRFNKHIEASAGIGALFLVTAAPPAWDEKHAINASDDGYGTFGADILINSVVFALTPGLGVSYSF
jgi:hypothetical protein